MAPDAKNKTFSPGLTSRRSPLPPPHPAASVNTETVYTTRSCVHLLFARWPSGSASARKQKPLGLRSAAIKKPPGASFFFSRRFPRVADSTEAPAGVVDSRTDHNNAELTITTSLTSTHEEKVSAFSRDRNLRPRPRTPTAPANLHADRYLRVQIDALTCCTVNRTRRIFARVS